MDFHKLQKVANRPVRFDGVPQRLLSQDAIPILSANLFSFNETTFFEVRDYSLNGSLCDSNFDRDLAKYHIGIAGNQYQNVRVVGQEGPPSGRLRSFRMSTNSSRPHVL